MRRAAVHAAVWLTTLALTLAVMQRVAAPGGGDILGSKLEHYQAAAGRYDTVFLGSSHVYRAFVPEVFDAVLDEAGHPVRSFNLGIQYPHQLELFYLAREVLQAGRGHLRHLFVEYQTLTPQIDPANAFHSRAVHWHDWATTELAMERDRAISDATPGGVPLVPEPGEHSILAVSESFLPSWWTLDRIHLQHFAKRELMVARGTDVIKGLLGRQHGQTGEWARTAGYLSLEEDERRMSARGNTAGSIQRRRAAFLADPGPFLGDVQALMHEERHFGDDEWMNADLYQVHDLAVYQAIAAEARRAGVELIVVIMPSSNCDRPAEERLIREVGVPVLRFNLPREFPELYDPELRFDSGHMNAEGAVAFTGELAGQWMRLRGGSSHP